MPPDGEKLPDASPPVVEVEGEAEGRTVRLAGDWNLRGLAETDPAELSRELSALREAQAWDLRGVRALDLAGALLLWRSWRDERPRRLWTRAEHEPLLSRAQGVREVPRAPNEPLDQRAARALQGAGSSLLSHSAGATALVGQVILDAGHLARHPRQIPWREISATIYGVGTRALKITALIGLLIGVVVSYLSSLQLRLLGAESYIVDLLGLSIIRELGPMLAAVLVAGRSGSALTAELGVMRVTQELDAMAALGISQTLRLVLPKVVALVLAMPLLVVWTDLAALLGGMLAAKQTVDIGLSEFLGALPRAVPIANYWIGLFKSLVFGGLIAMTASHFGMRIRPNTESLGRETTNSVVAAITQVILADAIFAVLFQGVGFQGVGLE